jgi:hypothetical protein
MNKKQCVWTNLLGSHAPQFASYRCSSFCKFEAEGDALYDLATLTLGHEEHLGDDVAGYGALMSTSG